MNLIKSILTIFVLMFFCSEESYSQQNIDYFIYGKVEGKDTVMVVKFRTITKYGKKGIPRFYRDLNRLKKAIMITYPIAEEARDRLAVMRATTSQMSNKREVRKYINSVEDELVSKYTSVIKKMTFYQGVILLKLLDRQTGDSGYVLLKELRSGFSAFFWNTLARLYGANLKLKYDPANADYMMEQYVLQYEDLSGKITVY